MAASLGNLADCLPTVLRPHPDLPSIDVRRAYLAWCAPSPWLLALVLASTTAWMLASPHVLAPLLAGFGATALLWFRSDGPGHASRLGSPASLALIGLTIWSETKPTAAGATLHLLLALATLLVATQMTLRLRTIMRVATRLQARVDAADMASRWARLSAALSALAARDLREGRPLAPSLHRTLVLATLAWAANEEAQAMERQR